MLRSADELPAVSSALTTGRETGTSSDSHAVRNAEKTRRIEADVNNEDTFYIESDEAEADTDFVGNSILG